MFGDQFFPCREGCLRGEPSEKGAGGLGEGAAGVARLEARPAASRFEPHEGEFVKHGEA